jgi:hypothetical protein
LLVTSPLTSAIATLLTLAPDGEINHLDHLTFVVGSQEMFGIDDATEVYGDDDFCAPRVPISGELMVDMDFD